MPHLTILSGGCKGVRTRNCYAAQVAFGGGSWEVGKSSCRGAAVLLKRGFTLAFVMIALAFGAFPARALEQVEFRLPGASETLAEALKSASLTEAARREGRQDAQDVLAAARSDYARLLAALYAQGYYSGVISIRIDGREAAGIAPLSAPARIREVVISVQPGPQFRFGRAEIGPLAKDTPLPDGFAPGEVAASGEMSGALERAIRDWREAGHAKAALARQSLVADHPRARLDARIELAPGPLAHLGQLRFAGQTSVRPGRLAAIAGFRSGRIYSPEEVRKSADRLRRTGVFQAVSMVEEESLGPGNTLDVTATLVDLPPRRIGGGMEFTTDEGLTLSGFWLHRNLFGGAERLRVEGKIARIGGAPLGLEFGLNYDRPATFTPDTDLNLTAQALRLSDGGVALNIGRVQAGLSHRFSERLTASAGVKYTFARLDTGGGGLFFQHLATPLAVTWDGRDDRLDPRRGVYLQAEASPFLGFDTTGSGVRLTGDARAYRPLGERLVFAGRLQGGLVLGADTSNAPRDYLFWSGGGGSVRGHPYQSLGITGGMFPTGGTLYLGASIEARVKITETIGAVAFYDFGLVEDIAAPIGNNWHGGAGLGLRYATGIGAIRLDLGLPAGGKPGNGVQIYLGIGQAF